MSCWKWPAINYKLIANNLRRGFVSTQVKKSNPSEKCQNFYRQHFSTSMPHENFYAAQKKKFAPSEKKIVNFDISLEEVYFSTKGFCLVL